LRARIRPRFGPVIAGVALAAAWLALTAGAASAQGGEPPAYREFPIIGSRVAIWIAAEVHLMFAAFMLGVPMFALVVEVVGMRTGEKRFDDLAREFTKLILVASSTTAAFGAVLTFLLFMLYPNYMGKLTDVFLPTMVIYPLLFFGEIFSLYLYWYSWDRLNTPGRKRWHLLIGLVLNLFGTALMFIANAWLTFAISPESGGQLLYDSAGNFSGTLGQAINNTTWWPINIHRVIALSWGLACFGATLGALFYSTRVNLEPDSWLVGLRAFAPALIGGMTSPLGVLPGALIVALVEVLAAQYLDPIMVNSAAFIVLLAALWIRPWGLFGTREEVVRV